MVSSGKIFRTIENYKGIMLWTNKVILAILWYFIISSRKLTWEIYLYDIITLLITVIGGKSNNISVSVSEMIMKYSQCLDGEY